MASSQFPGLDSDPQQPDTNADSRQPEVEPGEGPDRSAPGNDLTAALVIGIFAALTVVFSLRLDVPGSISTAPGLFPLIIGSTLFAMAAVLGWRAIRAGATIGALVGISASGNSGVREVIRALGGLPRRWANAFRAIGSTGETARTALLMALVTAYVLLVGLVNFEFSLPLGFFTVRISSYEVISVVMIAWILRLFWRAHVVRCAIVALVTVEALATIFRYGFGIPMPAGY